MARMTPTHLNITFMTLILNIVQIENLVLTSKIPPKLPLH